jgi:hypothetical protein
MNIPLDLLHSSSAQSLDARLVQQPELRQRLHLLIDVIDAAGGDCRRAAQAEARVLEEIRRLGLEALEAWSQRAEEHAQQQVSTDHPGAVRDGKKNFTGIQSSEKFR